LPVSQAELRHSQGAICYALLCGKIA
jgi:hypothetical protein